MVQKVKSKDFVIKFAGEGGQGLVTSADAMARAATGAGYYIQTFSTFPSQIMGGPASSQVRISTTPVLSTGDSIDVLVVLNQYAFDNHIEELSENGVCIYNAQDCVPTGEGNYFGINANELAKESGNTRAANMVILGAISTLIDFDLVSIENFVRERFTRGRDGDEEIISSNILALSLGSNVAKKSGFSVGSLQAPLPPKYEQIMITGNAALSLGAVSAGLDSYYGYPISPATTVLVWMEQNLISKDKFVFQVSSEIEAINNILGAGFSGKKAMTATAGPGIALMSEGIGLSWMAEIPCVIIDVQRGGPATGLPTKSEQSDLFACMFPAHGDVRLPVLAPGTVEECFYIGALATNWAERYQGPVMIMSEFSLAEKTENIKKPDLSKVKDERRDSNTGSNGYRRYESWNGKLSPMAIPGGDVAYVANGSEHDELGDTTHLPKHHVRLTERRFAKLDLLNDAPFEIENPESEIAIMPWGSSKGVAREAYDKLIQQNDNLSWIYSVSLNPLPIDVLKQLKQKKLVIVPELNYQGQWSSILRMEGINAVSVTQYTGLPFKPTDLANRILNKIKLEGD
tara:strand:+ start:1255 stop:2973 length:1719 start_codon:yes stop_codon:yes gene_type:complete